MLKKDMITRQRGQKGETAWKKRHALKEEEGLVRKEDTAFQKEEMPFLQHNKH